MVVLLKPNWFWTIHGNLRAQADYQPIVGEHHHAYKLHGTQNFQKATKYVT